MTMTRDDAVERLTWFYDRYLPKKPGEWSYLEDAIEALDAGLWLGRSLDEAYGLRIQGALVEVGLYKQAFPSHPIDPWALQNRAEWVSQLLPEEVLDFLYPEAAPADRAGLVDALQRGDVATPDLVAGWLEVAPRHSAPGATEVIAAVYDAGKGELPPAELDFPGVSQAQLGFLIALYVGAFGRAPEHEGLAYWAGDLARHLQEGWHEDAALRALAQSMYHSGTLNGEAGTAGDDRAFLEQVYGSVLGRAPDAEGRAYWLDELHEGAQTRDGFLHTFLTSALEAAGDSEYLQARVAVASHAAQAHVSGPGLAWPDLVGILAGVSSAGDAYRAIQQLREHAGEAPQAGDAGILAAAAFLVQEDAGAPWEPVSQSSSAASTSDTFAMQGDVELVLVGQPASVGMGWTGDVSGAL